MTQQLTLRDRPKGNVYRYITDIQQEVCNNVHSCSDQMQKPENNFNAHQQESKLMNYVHLTEYYGNKNK